MGGMIATELHDRPVICSPTELNRFEAPAGQSCGSYMAPFFAAGGIGHIVDNATSSCAYCAYSVGDEFYKPFGIDFADRWRDLGILFAFLASNLIILFLCVSAVSSLVIGHCLANWCSRATSILIVGRCVRDDLQCSSLCIANSTYRTHHLYIIVALDATTSALITALDATTSLH